MRSIGSIFDGFHRVNNPYAIIVVLYFSTIALLLLPQVSFPSLYELIDHYRGDPIDGEGFQIHLRHPVPPPVVYPEEKWCAPHPFHSITYIDQSTDQLAPPTHRHHRFLCNECQCSHHRYHHTRTRAQAEDMLRRLNIDGAFLVRRSGEEDFAFSFR